MNDGARILVVDDKRSFRFLVKAHLEEGGHQVTCAGDGAQALAELEATPFDLVLSDLVMPGMDGVALMKAVHERHPRMPFVLITAHGSVDGAVAAMREGAADYLLKPLHREELLVVVGRLLEQAELRVSFDRMMDVDRQRSSFQNITSRSPAMGRVLEAARQVAESPRTTVTLYGESGAGKEVLARAIHIASGLDLTRFVPVNCAAIPETLLESELFGHAKGAFTGAEGEREGKCGRAHGGTLFLDEIGDMPLTLQAKLLRLLENRIYEKVGSDRPQEAAFRIIVATHRDLAAACEAGTFRRDLFHRLNVFPITLPPLRERREDIPMLAATFLQGFSGERGRALPDLSPEALEALEAHPWPGNVRELRNLLEYATLVCRESLIRPEDLRLPPSLPSPGQPVDGDRITLAFTFARSAFSLEAVQRQVVAWALDQCGQNKSSAARLLNTTRKIFYPAP